MHFAGLVAALRLAGASAAAPITWVFAGQVGAIQLASPATLARLTSLGVAPGSPCFGQLVFESSTPDRSPLSNFGGYWGAISSFEITIGSLAHGFGSGAPQNDIVVDGLPGTIGALGYGPGSASPLDSLIPEIARVPLVVRAMARGILLLGDDGRILEEPTQPARVSAPFAAAVVAPALLALAVAQLGGLVGCSAACFSNSFWIAPP